MSRSVEKMVEDLTVRTKSLSQRFDRLSEAQENGLPVNMNFDENGGVVSYWGDAEAKPTVLKRGSVLRSGGRMPKGYKGAHSVYKSFGDMIVKGFKNDPDFSKKHGSIYKSILGMNVQTGQDGGYLVPPEYAAEILDRSYTNDIWNRTDNYTVSGNGMIFTRNAETSRRNGSRHGGLTSYWGAEGATMTATKPTMKEVSLRLKKLYVVIYMTQELMSDAPAAEQYARRKAREELAFRKGAAVFEGTGAGQPLGVLNSGALLAVSKEGGQAADTIVSANIDKMWARRIITGGNYSWYHNQDCGPQLDNLAQDVGTGGIALYRTGDQIAQAAPQSLKGAARVETEFNETLGDQGDIALADLSQVLSISAAGITEESSIHVEFLTDQTAIKFTERVDCQPWEDTPITPYKGTNTQSAFIVLEARA